MTVWHSVILEERRPVPADYWVLSGTWDDWKCTYAEKRAHVNDLILLQHPVPGSDVFFTGAYTWLATFLPTLQD